MDALSQDETEGLTIIAFIGSVFSPYYAWARAKQPADPYNFCALNVAYYGAKRHYWSMTERRRTAIDVTEDSYAIGPSTLRWDGTSLTITFAETTVPLPSVLRGQVTITPLALQPKVFALGQSGQHRWHPIGPIATAEVALQKPARQWRGSGYFDMNYGSAPLEEHFQSWCWSRSSKDNATDVLYDIENRSSGNQLIAVRFREDGHYEEFAEPPPRTLPRSFWRMERSTRGHQGVRVARTLEDSPFYTRSLLVTEGGRSSVHESLSLDRFQQPIVKLMLPFRMPRDFWSGFGF